jgi:hypothetical protein
MGHADPRTTRAYDRSRHRLDNHATYAMAAWLRRSPGGEPTDAAASGGAVS